MVGHGGSSAGSYLADPTSPIPSHCTSIVATSTVRVKSDQAEWTRALSRTLTSDTPTYCVLGYSDPGSHVIVSDGNNTNENRERKKEKRKKKEHTISLMFSGRCHAHLWVGTLRHIWNTHYTLISSEQWKEGFSRTFLSGPRWVCVFMKEQNEPGIFQQEDNSFVFWCWTSLTVCARFLVSKTSHKTIAVIGWVKDASWSSLGRLSTGSDRWVFMHIGWLYFGERCIHWRFKRGSAWFKVNKMALGAV